MELTTEQIAELTPDQQTAYAQHLAEIQIAKEKLEKHFTGLQASVDLINSMIAANDRSDEVLDRISRNYKHIEIMLAQDYIANDPRDKTVFLDSVVNAMHFLNLNN